MKMRKYSTKKLSEIYDTVCNESADIRELYPDICSDSLQEYLQLEKTVIILKSMKEMTIKDPESFCAETLNQCLTRKVFRLSLVNRLALPAAAAVIVVVGALSFNAYNDAPVTGGDVVHIASEVDSTNSYVINVDNKKDADQIKNAIIDHGGVVLKEDPQTIIAKARITNYIALKKDLTLSEEDKIFYNKSRNLMLAGTNSNVYTSDYVDQTITFEIKFK